MLDEEEEDEENENWYSLLPSTYGGKQLLLVVDQRENDRDTIRRK